MFFTFAHIMGIISLILVTWLLAAILAMFLRVVETLPKLLGFVLVIPAIPFVAAYRAYKEKSVKYAFLALVYLLFMLGLILEIVIP